MAALTQPKIQHYCHWLEREDYFGMHGVKYDVKSEGLLDELFDLINQIAPISENGTRALWLHANRGPIEDFGNAEEEVACGNYDSKEEFISEWEGWFPDEVEWYYMTAIQDKGYRAITLRHKVVIMQDESRTPFGYPNEVSEFVQWLLDSVRECIDMLRAGTYNEYVEKNLPPRHRTGTIVRKDLWAAWPSEKEAFLCGISESDIAEFGSRVSEQGDAFGAVQGRIDRVTANDFFRYCALGYAANQYAGCDLTPREQYYKHADGRDDGLGDIDPDDPTEFHNWLHRRTQYGGHPWEVCRGGNSTHISLHVMDDAQGYYLHLAGTAESRTIETVRFYLALARAELPVYIEEGGTLVKRMAGEEKIGIVPDGVAPVYCGCHFPVKEHIIDFMNLPIEDEDRAAMLPYCKWYDIPKTSLALQERLLNSERISGAKYHTPDEVDATLEKQ